MNKSLYFIDDNINKYNNVLLAMQLLNSENEKSGDTINYIPGFGIEPGQNSGFWSDIENVDKYFDALKDPDGIFFIDLRIEDSYAFASEILSRLENNSEYENILKEFLRLRNAVSFSSENNKALALLTLAICSKLGIKVLIASVQAEHIGYVRELTELGYQSFDGFIPIEALDLSNPLIIKMANSLKNLHDPIEEIISKTRNWFCSDELDLDNATLPHNDFEVLNQPDGRNLHMKIVRAQFPWLPEKWWKNDESLKQIHNILKSFCGPNMQWCTNGKTPLSLAGAYFTFLYVAYGQIKKYNLAVELYDKLCINDLSCFFYKSGLQSFTNRQNARDAKDHLKALMSFFNQIAINKNFSNERPSLSFVSVTGPEYPERASVCIRLNWEPEQRENFADHLSLAIKNKVKETDAIQHGTAISSFLSLILLHQNNLDGFGNNNGIALDNCSNLIIGHEL